jgi:hypothetical protein
MSTKSTICQGDDFHFYSEVGDDYNVYLQLDKAAIEEISLNQDRLQVCIPAAIWKKISEHADVDLSFAQKTNKEIHKMVSTKVDERILHMQKCKEEEKLISSMAGLLVYGDVQDERETQIESGMKYFVNKRDMEIKIVNRYKKYE